MNGNAHKLQDNSNVPNAKRKHFGIGLLNKRRWCEIPQKVSESEA
jgi:hypothetical protein